jgi:hypothetical protein
MGTPVSKDPGLPEKVATIPHPADDASPTASPDQNGHAVSNTRALAQLATGGKSIYG